MIKTLKILCCTETLSTIYSSKTLFYFPYTIYDKIYNFIIFYKNDNNRDIQIGACISNSIKFTNFKIILFVQSYDMLDKEHHTTDKHCFKNKTINHWQPIIFSINKSVYKFCNIIIKSYCCIWQCVKAVFNVCLFVSYFNTDVKVVLRVLFTQLFYNTAAVSVVRVIRTN